MRTLLLGAIALFIVSCGETAEDLNAESIIAKTIETVRPSDSVCRMWKKTTF